jgi:hypothetical protein
LDRDDRLYVEQRQHIVDGKTLSGRLIILPAGNEQNYARVCVSSVQYRICVAVRGEEACWLDLEGLARIADILSSKLGSAEGLPNKKPPLLDSLGRQLLPEPPLTFWDLIVRSSYGGGIVNVRRLLCLPADAYFDDILAAAGLLQMDRVIEALDSGKEARAMYELHDGIELLDSIVEFQDMTSEPTQQEIQDALAHKHLAQSSRGGQRTAEVKKQAARLSGEVAIRERDKLLALGKAAHEIAGILAARFDVTPKHVRTTLRKAEANKEADKSEP